MRPLDYIEAARVPHSLGPQEFGSWRIQRIAADMTMVEPNMTAMGPGLVGFPDYTLLRRTTGTTLHPAWEVVMEDSARELRKHLPIWMAAHGRVLVTGLGLGCVVRGLLAKPEIEHVDVVEIDPDILRVVGAEFRESERVTLIEGDALRVGWPPDIRWHFAWHDLWIENGGLQFLHAELLHRYRGRVRAQGAWAFPRGVARLYATCWNWELIGAPVPRGAVFRKPLENYPSKIPVLRGSRRPEKG